MASLQKKYTAAKLNGQIYTPAFLVAKILDDIGYAGKQLLGKTLLDPACGDGRFLCEAARRIAAVSPPDCLVQHWACLYGWDIDPEAVAACIRNLDQIAAPYGLSPAWNIAQRNALTEPYPHQFDAIVGNPPYVRIQHIDETQRRYLQQHYQFCRNGSTDIYIAFFEYCYQHLAPEGICALLTPNTFFYTQTAQTLRNFFADKQNLIQISNYADIQLFDKATTYSAITLFDRRRRDTFLFQKAISPLQFAQKQIGFEQLKQRTWQLSTEDAPPPLSDAQKLGNIAQIHVGITTLCDKAYIFRISQTDGQHALAHTALAGEVWLEKSLLRPIVKASTLKSSSQAIVEYILFPYQKNERQQHRIIPEAELAQQYPRAYAYLQTVKPHLDRRDNGKPNSVAWYAFGRSQGLDTGFGPKILFSPMNKTPNFIAFDREECTFYSGSCIKPHQAQHTAPLLNQLNSLRMGQFIALSARDFRNGWKAYNKQIVANFDVSMSKLLP